MCLLFFRIFSCFITVNTVFSVFSFSTAFKMRTNDFCLSQTVCLYIGVGRFRILGGQGLEFWGAKGGGGPNSQQAHDVVTTSMRRNDVASTSFRRRVPTRFLINQCQIITLLILKYDIIENSRIELRGIVLPVQVGGLLGGGQRVCWPPLSNYWGGLAPLAPPLPTPMLYVN